MVIIKNVVQVIPKFYAFGELTRETGPPPHNKILLVEKLIEIALH